MASALFPYHFGLCDEEDETRGDETRAEETAVRCSQYLPADSDREGPLVPVPPRDQRHLARGVGAWPGEDLVRVAVLGGVEGAARVGVRVRGEVGVDVRCRGGVEVAIVGGC